MEQLFSITIYQNVPSKYVDELVEFRSVHPVRCRLIDGLERHYTLSGVGTATMLILGRAMSTAEASRSLIQSLEKDCCVLAPAIKPVYVRPAC